MLTTITDVIEAANEGDEIPEFLADPETGEDAFQVTYVSTDAWRGFYNSQPVNGGWVKVDEGWMTGDWGDAPAGHSSSEVKEKLDAMAAERDTVVVFLPTSNVFSTGYDVYQRALLQ